ncbi:PilZ domain-containing protein [Sporosarcina sp. 179-K 3D1 HS]|uniref:PilZ domain-containing protein n=1 Tax=Sporosarcina sp. 179-K 3D1 HS TaxID=3232169 RepID=UPI0039A29979
MLYKRTEYFRYTFGEPLDAEFRILKAEGQSNPGECKMVDLSPGGAKLYSSYDIPIGQDEAPRLSLKFTVYNYPLEVPGTVLWKKPFNQGHMYGFEFDEDRKIGELIIGELKLRRRAETDSNR